MDINGGNGRRLGGGSDSQEDYEAYGKTPPRTRILRKNRERRFKDKDANWAAKASPKDSKVTVKRNISRRNTITTMFDELIAKSEEGADSTQVASKKAVKRSAKLLRGSERDLKLNITAATAHPVTFHQSSDAEEDGGDEVVAMTPHSRQVETCKRFMSLCSRKVTSTTVTVGEDNEEEDDEIMMRRMYRGGGGGRIEGLRPASLPARARRCRTLIDDMSTYGGSILMKSLQSGDSVAMSDSMKSRLAFHQSLSLLIGMGRAGGGGGATASNGERSSQEKTTQRHLSREEHRWQNELKDLIWLELQAWHADRSLGDQDEYICSARDGVAGLLDDIMTYRFEREVTSHERQRATSVSADSGVSVRSGGGGDCDGCVSLYCQCCMDAQNKALRDVEVLMNRLEEAEALYPSSQAFGDHYPLYKSPEFVGRVKAMCLWYNMTRHQRLKLVILSRLLALLESNNYPYPQNGNGGPYETIDSMGSPSDSNSSNSSSVTTDYFQHGSSDTGGGGGGGNNLSCTANVSASELWNLTTFSYLAVGATGTDNDNTTAGKVSPYRKYIENILKTRGLGKSMNFLERLHTHVLWKAQMTLEKPSSEDLFKQCADNTLDELRRYGSWSPEAQSLNLPSYRALFLFLSGVPLEVVNEFLRMRLEQKPENPSALSVRQLMRELREGLKIATQQREKITLYVDTLIQGSNEGNRDTLQTYKDNILRTFDQSLQLVFTDYLGYIEQWALLDGGAFQTTLLEDEWAFIGTVVGQIEGGCAMACTKFCAILGAILASIGERLMVGIDELALELQSLDAVNRKQNLFTVLRELQYLFREEREMCSKTITFTKAVFKTDNLCIDQADDDRFREAVLSLKCTIPNAIERVEKMCDIANMESLDDAERASLNSRCREILMQGYRFGFDFHQNLSEFIPNAQRERLARSMVQFATLWMRFVTKHCDRGRGRRPLWAQQGLDFLIIVCNPQYTTHLTEEEFGELKRNMDKCITHVVGTRTPTRDSGVVPNLSSCLKTGLGTPDSGIGSGGSTTASSRASNDSVRFPRSRGSSPSPRTYRSQRSNATINTNSRRTSTDPQQPPIGVSSPATGESDSVDSPSFTALVTPPPSHRRIESLVEWGGVTRGDRVKEAVGGLDKSIDDRLKRQELIGKVVDKNPTDRCAQVKRRLVKFSWQRGIKIGQGRFGKVYTAVNNSTGEMMAVKEVALQRNDVHTIRQVSGEMKIMEGISHRNLVRYYGLEVHKEEMLIFMEFCEEGTLESLVASTEHGLPELLTRRFTYQLLSGIEMLHNHGIVHRDIKTANIFLTDEGNCLKIGDFGCAAKIKSHATVAGELQGVYGTQAYMAPEIFVRPSMEGHGRAVDVWSVGCVVVEMASGKRPWTNCELNQQIMFKVGMGERPETPDSLIDEGHDFLDLCFQHNPQNRATVLELLGHNFVKAGDDLD